MGFLRCGVPHAGGMDHGHRSAKASNSPIGVSRTREGRYHNCEHGWYLEGVLWMLLVAIWYDTSAAASSADGRLP
eukprot:33228-Eustigmatos_ZCMA.PRE.1